LPLNVTRYTRALRKLAEGSVKVVIRYLSMAGALLLVSALVGCGTASTPVATKPRIAFVSPAIVHTKGLIPARYKCDENKIWLPLSWGALPANTKEIVIYVARFGQPKIAPGSAPTAALLAQQLIVGLKPTLHNLRVGRLPHGALIGSYEEGLKRESICPKQGAGQGILFGLYALPSSQDLSKGSQSANLLAKLRSEAVAVGTFTANFGRA
jgi:hypothetical protein